MMEAQSYRVRVGLLVVLCCGADKTYDQLVPLLASTVLCRKNRCLGML